MSRVKVKGVIQDVPTFSIKQIKDLISELNMSQREFALVLGISIKTLEAWLSGVNKPSGSASRLLQMIECNPDVIYDTGIIIPIE